MDAKMQKNKERPEAHESKLTVKSIGYAAHNLELDTNLLEILPAEELGYVDGEITDDREKMVQEGVDAKGNTYIDEIETSNSMVAEWLQWGSNRFSPPNVRRGERVLIWQYSDEDKYYWTTTGMDDHLRRRETAVYNYSNTIDETVTEINSTNSYSFIVSTHTKEITIQTTKTDGEKFGYIIKLDTKAGLFIVTDDLDNQISLESEEKRITLLNADKSSVVVDKKNITLTAIDTIDLVAKNVNINSTTHTINTDKADINAKDHTLNATTANIKATTHSIKATDANVDVSAYNMLGAGMDFSGSPMIARQGIVSYGKIINNGVNVGSTHTHTGVETGPSTTGTPK